MDKPEFNKLEKPVGDFIMNQKDIKPLFSNTGSYYHYSDVCKLLKRYKNF